MHHGRSRSRRSPVALGLAALILAAGCTAPGDQPDTGASDPAPEQTAQPTPTPTPSPEPDPEPTLAWGPAESDLASATEVAEQMDDDELAGQVIIARYSGTHPGDAAALVQTYHLAGVILFAENITSTDQVRDTAAAVQEGQAEMSRDWPAVISVDNEGGPVQRMSAESGDWTTFPPFAAAGAADPDAVSTAMAAMATELRASGVTMNFAPVADVSIGAADPTINMRAAGDDPERVSETVRAALTGFAAGGVLTSVKHFPGHGALTVDSHYDLPVLDAGEQHLAERDLVPFADAIEAGAPMVMLGHIAAQAWDEGVPATLSPRAYDVLREDLGFTGVAITDGLDMGALTATRTSGQIAVEALDAGADLLLTPADTAGAHAAIMAALEDGSLDRDRVREAAGRVIALQRWQAGLAEEAGEVDDGDVGSAAQAARDLSAAAITVAAGECSGELVGQRLHVRGGTSADWTAFAEAAERAGLDVVPLEEPADTSIRLISAGTSAAGGDVAIALDGPWQLAGADAPTLIATHGRTAGSLEALVEVLTGAADAPGRLAFAVEGLPASACA
ncbi:glycoside hydrolase family 3 N-terminal domain-containing protein [Pseudactinotalea sp. Z1739]|uniref:glycoside hydrolase family 3 N-terminal domain-containing protein n=1 Tax=Pseudactinotalea sp. Z1739 TaxID=3413028 RepID=UPI003C79FDA7